MLKIKYELFLESDEFGEEYEESSVVESSCESLLDYVLYEYGEVSLNDIDGSVLNDDGSIEVLNEEYGKYYKWSVVEG